MSGTKVAVASKLSTNPDTVAAVAEVCEQVSAVLGSKPDLALVFISHEHTASIDSMADGICQKLGTENLLGCTGESIVGTRQEIEEGPAVSLWAASLPNSKLERCHLNFQRTPDGGAITGWPTGLPEQWPEDSAMLLLGEPFSFPADYLLQQLGETQPGIPVLGGMASGAAEPGQNKLVYGCAAVDTGAVAVLIQGDVSFRHIVSQGCRPIGAPMVITKAERNVIEQLGGRSAMQQLEDVFNSLPTSEQKLVQNGLHVGRVVNEYQDQFRQGDFLVRNVVGIDREAGSVVIGDYVRPGQTVQFHVRDSRTADEDLKLMLAQHKKHHGSVPAGGLMFTCNGRGTRLFSDPHHDAVAVAETFGDIPLAGLFAQGEIGPVGGKNFVHGFTASLALFG